MRRCSARTDQAWSAEQPCETVQQLELAGGQQPVPRTHMLHTHALRMLHTCYT